jgi:hypothetical protein
MMMQPTRGLGDVKNKASRAKAKALLIWRVSCAEKVMAQL